MCAAHVNGGRHQELEGLVDAAHVNLGLVAKVLAINVNDAGRGGVELDVLGLDGLQGVVAHVGT